MKIHRDHIEWGYEAGYVGALYYFWWWNWLPPGLRYIGYCQDWHNGPISSFGFWFINWSWETPWTRHEANYNYCYSRGSGWSWGRFIP